MFDFSRLSAWRRSLSGEDYVAALFLAVVFFLPFFFWWPVQSLLVAAKIQFLAVGVGLLLIIWLLGNLRAGVIALPASGFFWSQGAVIFLSLLSAFFSPLKSKSFVGLLDNTQTWLAALLFFLLFLLASRVLNTASRWFYFYLIFGLSFVCFFLWQIVWILVGPFGSGFFPQAATFNLLGKWLEGAIWSGFVLLGSVAIWELAPISRFRFGRWALGILVALSLLAVVFFNFYLLWPILFVASAVLSTLVFYFSWRQKKIGGRIRLFRPGLLLFFLALTMTLVARPDSYVYQKIEKIKDSRQLSVAEIKPSFLATSEVGRVALAARPWFGSGPNSFAVDWQKFKPPSINQSEFWPLDFPAGAGRVPTLALSTGWLGILSWLIFFGFFIYAVFRALRFSIAQRQPPVALIASFLAALYFWIIEIFYLPGPVITTFTFVFSGLLLAVMVKHGLAGEWKFVWRKQSAGLGFLSIALVLILIAGTIWGEYVVNRVWRGVHLAATTSVAAADPVLAVATLERAARLYPADVFYRQVAEVKYEQLKKVITSENFGETIKTGETPEKLANDALQYLRLAQAADSQDYRNFTSYGEVVSFLSSFRVSGAVAEAIRSYEQALALSPKHPQILLNLAELYLLDDNLPKSQEYLNRALVIKPDWAPAVELRARLSSGAGGV